MQDKQQIESNATGEQAIERGTVDPLSRIDGLDLEAGLYYAANNRDLYETILNAFVKNNLTTVAKIRATLAANDMETARRTAHALKGTAGTIGATALQQAAKATEYALDSGQSDEMPMMVQALEAHIEPLLRQIRCALAPGNKQP